VEGEGAADQLRVAVAEVRSIQFDDGRDVAESSARTTFEIGGGADRANAGGHSTSTSPTTSGLVVRAAGVRSRDAAGGTTTAGATDDGIVRAGNRGARASDGEVAG
jgi:hypothetical protein